MTLHVQFSFITSSSTKLAFVKVWIHDTELADSSKLTSNPNVWKLEIKKTQNNKNCPNKLNQEEIGVELILQRTNLEQMPLNRSQQQQQQQHTNNLLTESTMR